MNKFFTVGDLRKKLNEYPDDQTLIVNIAPLIGARIVGVQTTNFVDTSVYTEVEAVSIKLEEMISN